jgi:hypothetical protein
MRTQQKQFGSFDQDKARRDGAAAISMSLENRRIFDGNKQNPLQCLVEELSVYLLLRCGSR